MKQCYKCHFEFRPEEIAVFSSGRGYCQTCVLESYYNCENCGVKFTIGDFSSDYSEGKKLAWKTKLNHTKSYHGY